MRTARAEHRLTYGQTGQFRRRRRGRDAKIPMQARADVVHAVLARRGCVPGQFAPDADRKMVFPGQLQQSAFYDRVEFFEHKHFVQALEKGEREFVREGKGRRDLEHFRLRAAERIHEIGVAHAAGGDAFAAFARDSIARITRERGR